MKYKLITLTLSLLLTHLLIAQSEARVAAKLKEMSNDTARYINEYIIARKDFYIGKPFDTLFKDMPLPLRGCVNEMNPKNRFISTFTIFYFYNYWKRNSYANLLITWDSSFDKRDLERHGSPALGKWTQAAYNYYRNRIIKNMEMLNNSLAPLLVFNIGN